MSLLRLMQSTVRTASGAGRCISRPWIHAAAVRAADHARRPAWSTRSLPVLARYYHDDGVYGYRRPHHFHMPDCSCPPHADTEKQLDNRRENANLLRLVIAYRTHGHRNAKLDPLGLQEIEEHVALQPSRYGLTDAHKAYNLDGILHMNHGTSDGAQANTANLHTIIEHLRSTYCGRIAYEFVYMPDASERRWFAHRVESLEKPPITPERRKRYHELLARSEVFDLFMQKRFPQVKRYGLEGAEAMLVALDQLFHEANHAGVREAIVCMAHRGRLNLLADLLEYPPRALFHKVKGNSEFPEGTPGIGDVLSHIGASPYIDYGAAEPIHVELMNNPSHLEAVNPVALGKARAKQMALYDTNTDANCQLGDRVMCVQVHGDAGVVMETLGLSNLSHFTSGGSIHLIVNNQLGYTTPAMNARSSIYASDIGKMVNAPVIHVNGDHPEDVARAMEVAFEYRNKFRKDVVVDLITYRRWGHNELDEPGFTQPLMYETIRSRKSVPQLYEEKLLAEGILTKTDVQRTIHPRLKRYHVQSRNKRIDEGRNIDWATAEALAFGSLLLEGYNVRISGQDVGRGTFSQRHAMLVCQRTERVHIPLNSIAPRQGWLEVANSSLSEFAVMGFEYGMSLETPRSLNIWEAQFGDFNNTAQVIIDTYVSSGEAKWLRQSGLVLLLPHGYDGAGPEHSSCRVERFLQICDDRFDVNDRSIKVNPNMHIVNCTTPAQYFHVLRRQMRRPFRKPLIVVAPKTLLRLADAVSDMGDMLPSTSFQPVLADPHVKSADSVKRVAFLSGKVYYELVKERAARGLEDAVALVRVEELAPFPRDALAQQISNYPNATEYVWLQEEPQNSGAYTFMAPRLGQIMPDGHTLGYIGRATCPAPATGIAKQHKQERQQLLANAFAGLA
ncbi:thiamine diphosphate-binding protein [Syncephalis pseudoplumigaleata]|uniref:Thiamine diphosphate-binding protein n=1 Tax=Syncephalis pseudoplumigaleata TaxID=1712513 RepID=A0A4P9Z6R7_9FUNG|nr:thiamine diphosphate-binding protein [Syncephalis pseudoplumigaleata]|eukprot:RKP28148.1 thiamine diphosphate-binding protein [Syncephalis pseudoplumigaleata]